MIRISCFLLTLFVSVLPAVATEIDTESLVEDLKEGSMLVCGRPKPTQVKSRYGTAYCSAGSAALFFDNGRSVGCFGLDTARNEDIKFVIFGKTFLVHPGFEVVITGDASSSFSEDQGISGINYRRVHSTELVNGHTVFVAQYSIASALRSIKELRELVLSPRKEDQKCGKRILKNAAIQG